MAHILALSSWVAHGHVGLSAATPTLHALGHNVTQLPTVQLSNHPGFPHVAGAQTDPNMLRGLVGALDRNQMIQGVDTILTGYLPSAAHVEVAVDLITRFKGKKTRVVVDPVLGDHPKGLYIAQDAAEAVRDRLVPLADVLTPNAFELSWLTDLDASDFGSATQAAVALRECATDGEILLTSPPFDGDQTGVLAISSTGIEAFKASRAPENHSVPHGVGDVFSALVAAELPTSQALGHLQALIAQSLDAPHLRIVETASHWTAAKPIAAHSIAH